MSEAVSGSLYVGFLIAVWSILIWTDALEVVDELTDAFFRWVDRRLWNDD